ncbi:hypothetical protein ATB98_00150 [Sinorhizobium saheli]|uniref:Uncharacterized protein n=1 Tax=Sinorhizobium saheli TaxID=36856 RepID=A0A178Y9H1_SINSA|nr:hypothetical protein ATB98_00150 [Sinorhizobium saheli]
MFPEGTIDDDRERRRARAATTAARPWAKSAVDQRIADETVQCRPSSSIVPRRTQLLPFRVPAAGRAVA